MLQYDDALYEVAGLSPPPIRQSPYITRLMQSTYEQTMGEWRNATATTAEAAQITFVNACDKAYYQVMSGAMAANQAVKEAVDTVVSSGVTVTYPTGHQDTIETATARAVRTGISQGAARIQLARMKEMGIDLVLVSSHLGARPEHALWQGKVYSLGGEYKGQYPDFEQSTGFGTVTGLCGANCRHSFNAWFPGMENPWKQYDTEENRKEYEKEQRQRAMERKIRKTKREVMGYREAMEDAKDESLRGDLEKEYQRRALRLQQQNAAYHEYCKENGLKKQSDRISIAQWDRQQAAQATAAARKREKNLSFIREDAKMKAESGLPKKIEKLPNEELRHTVNVDIFPDKPGGFEFHAVAPKGTDMAKIEVMAGRGTSTPIRDLQRLYETYNCDADGWQKKSGTAWGKEYHYVIHWYENDGFIPQGEIKLKGMKKNK